MQTLQAGPSESQESEGPPGNIPVMATCSGCWQPRGPRMVYGGTHPVLDVDGMVQLAAYPDCHEPYNDLDHRAETLYVAGWGTENEKVFIASRARRGSGYSKSFNPELLMVPVLAVQLCRQAVLDAYAETD